MASTKRPRPPPCDIGGDYLFSSQPHLSLPGQLPSTSHPYTVTPPESLASGVREFGHEDVGRLSDVLEEDGERMQSIDQDEVEIKDVVLLEELPEQTTTNSPSIQMVNVRPNKISAFEGEARTVSKGSPLVIQTFQKDLMRDIFVNISTTGNMPELLVLEGADGGVVIHKGIISAYSKLVQQQLEVFPDCTTVYIPNYSQKILRKVVEILYTGETFYSEDEKKDVNLIWEAMRQLVISFDDKSFYYHPVECTVVKEDCEDSDKDMDNSDEPQEPEVVPPTEVDQTDECWHESSRASTQKGKGAFSYCRVVRRPHPADPARVVFVESKCGEGKRIQRSKPAAAHINEEENKKKEKLENIRQAKIILSKHKPVVVDLVDESDDDDGPTPSKKTRTETFAPATAIIRDESFIQLVTSGQVSIDMVRAAALGVNQPAKTNHSLTDPVSANSCGTGDESSQSNDSPLDRFPMVSIPPNRPAGTTILMMNTSPIKATEVPSSSPSTNACMSPTKDMPKLQAIDEGLPTQTGLRTRRKSHDILDLPKLDKAYDDSKTGPQNESDPNVCSSNVNNEVPTVAAAVVPAAKVRPLMVNQRSPFARNINSNPVASTSRCNDETTDDKKFRQRRVRFVEYSESSVDELNRLREAYRKEQHGGTKPPMVIGSKKLPLPENVTVDVYVENLQEGESDEVARERLEKELNLPPVSASSVTQGDVYAFLNDFVSTRKTTNKPMKPGASGRGRRGRGRGSRGAPGTSNVLRNSATSTVNDLITSGPQATPEAGTSRGRNGRRGSRRGV